MAPNVVKGRAHSSTQVTACPTHADHPTRTRPKRTNKPRHLIRSSIHVCSEDPKINPRECTWDGPHRLPRRSMLNPTLPQNMAAQHVSMMQHWSAVSRDIHGLLSPRGQLLSRRIATTQQNQAPTRGLGLLNHAQAGPLNQSIGFVASAQDGK